jgi:O-antigen/teichoic acid export membrane protein
VTSRAESGSRVRRTGAAAQVAGSQIGLALSNYLVLVIAARHLDTAGFAALTSYYLLINTVGRGLFAAVELEATRAVADAVARGHDTGPAVRTARNDTLRLLVVALVLSAVAGPLLLGQALGSSALAIGMLAAGAVTMAASYLLRGPLAGRRRYGLYAATFWIEALVGLAVAAVFVVVDVRGIGSWVAILALAPIVSALVLARPATRVPAAPEAVPGAAVAVPAAARGGVFWSAALLLAGQGVWNLAAVFVTSRLADTPAIAAGFVTVAVILRAPVLLFPAVQAILLPSFTAMLGDGDHSGVRTIVRRLGLVLAGGGVVWLVLSVFVVPWAARLLFGATVVPPAWVLLVLAASTVVGAAAQIGQTRLVAERRPAAVAVAWIAGLALLVVVAFLAAPPVAAAAIGQLAAAVAVFVLLAVAARRTPDPGATP